MAASSISNLFPFFTPSKPPPLPKTAPPHLSLSSDDHTLSSSKNRYGLVASTNDAAQYPFSSSTDVMSVVCPSLAYANTLFFSSGYNVEIIVEEDEPEERLLNRFRREVMRAGIIQECKRRRYYENKQDAKKRKTREAAKRNRRRRGGWTQDREEVLENKKEEDDDDDNWELPEGDLPY